MNFLQKPVGIEENEVSIMAYFQKTSLYVEINSYRVEKCLDGWWRVDCLTIGGYVHSTKMLCHFDCGCDLIVGSPTVSFIQSLNLVPSSRYSLETTNPFNVVVFELNDIDENSLLETLKKRYESENLFIADKNSEAVLISEKLHNVEFNECHYTVFCIAKVKNGKLHCVILNPDMMMLEDEGF